MRTNSIAFFVAFNICKLKSNDYAIPYTHYTYLEYLNDRYSKVYLICGVKANEGCLLSDYHTSVLKNVDVIEMPECTSFISAQIHFLCFYKALKEVVKKVDVVYCRVPDPFSWMPRLLFHKKTIMHFVGDAIDATKHNENWSKKRKIFMIIGYLPDYYLTLLAASKSKVYTNGYHLADKLRRRGIKATSVISSTVSQNSLINPMPYKIHDELRLIYVGYIRYSKGMNCLMNLWLKLKKQYPKFYFDLVGSGEMMKEVKQFIISNDLSHNIIIHGHIDNRDELNELLRNDDLFIFPSLSEGSPRVIIEAMAAGIPVISTPVGSLPTTFEDGKTIRYFDFNDVNQAFSIIKEYVIDNTEFLNMRDLAFDVVKTNFTIERFLSKVFTYN